MQPSLATPNLTTTPRAAINRANAQHSTGPLSPQGKRRASQNALTHGLTARTAVLPTEDPAAYQLHCQQFRDEYQPKTPTETQLVQELADTTWRLNRVPLLEARILSGRDGLAILDAHRRALQADRREREARDLKQAASLLDLDKSKGIEYDPAQDGFVFSMIGGRSA